MQERQPLAELAAQWDISVACVYNWVLEFMTRRFASLVYARGGGRRAKLTAEQKTRLGQLLDGGPHAAGLASEFGACWSSLAVVELIEREFGVRYSRFYVCTLLRNLGYSYQKAEVVSDHLDEARRRVWMEETWPGLLAAATARGALILFGDEASFAQWGSLSYTWAKRGQTPQVKTSGKRKAYKVFGLIEFFAGRLFYGGSEGRFNSASYQAFLLGVRAATSEHLFVIQDGARYHTSAAMSAFFAEQQERMTVFQLPSYSPDYNPIEYLWRKTKKKTTHNEYFAQFEGLSTAVEAKLAYFAAHPGEVQGLFGRYCRETNLLPQEIALAA